MNNEQEYARFAALLQRVVSTPRAIVLKREQEEENTKAWRKDNGIRAKRYRITSVSPASVSDAKLP